MEFKVKTVNSCFSRGKKGAACIFSADAIEMQDKCGSMLLVAA
jgi:hypothetical protein